MPAKKKTTKPDIDTDIDLDEVDDLEPDIDEESDNPNIDPDAIPDDLQFSTTTPDDDEESEPIWVTIDGIRCRLNQPDEMALGWRLGELNSAQDVFGQVLALLGVLGTSIDKTGYLIIKERMLSLKEPGKKFDPEIVVNLVNLILDKWGNGRTVPTLKKDDEPQNRQQRRAQQRKRR